MPEVIGIVGSPSKIDGFDMVLLPEKTARRGEYCIFRHPIHRGVWCLGRIIGGRRTNPEILPTAMTALLFKMGYHISPEREVSVLDVEAIGYRDESGFKPMDFPVAPGEEVYRAETEIVRNFLGKSDGIQILVGKDPYSNLDISLSLDVITKGHMAICGMTRSGKSTFALTFIREACKNKAKFLIFDRTGEYVQPLDESGIRCEVLNPNDLQGLSSLTEESLAARLGLGSRASDKYLVSTLLEIIQEEGREKLSDLDYILEKCSPKIKMYRESTLAEIKRTLNRKKEELKSLQQMREEAADIIECLKKNQVTIVDFSTERSIEKQQMAVTNVLEQIFNFAISTRGEELTFLVLIEEAQFYAPEIRLISYGNPKDTGSLDMVTAGLSQLGGFNVGFIVMTQRPAYVSKSVLSQCNTLLSFRLMSGADHEQIASVTGYSQVRVANLLSNLEDHVGYLIGMASPFGFPVFVQTRGDRLYPRKATKTPSQLLLST